MPYYELNCRDCSKPFTAKASVRERSEGLIACPDCGGKNLDMIYKPVAVLKYAQARCDSCTGSSCPAMPASASSGCAGGLCGHSH